jgi:hypothetical protein
MIRHFVLWIVLFLTACGVSDQTSASEGIKEKINHFEIDSGLGKIDNIAVGMAEAEVMALRYPKVTRIINKEGEKYLVIDLAIAKGVVVACLFDQTGRVYEISTSSSAIGDMYGLGVGSTLREIEKKYPSGVLWVGEADGPYANFVTGTAIIFRLDRSGIDDRCFDQTRAQCQIKKTTTVSQVVVGRGED